VAKRIDGKSAQECQVKHFENLASPTLAKKKRQRTANEKSNLDFNKESMPLSKLARTGTNKFKKQVRQFVEQVMSM